MRKRKTRAAQWPTVACTLTMLCGASGAYAFDVNDFLPCEPLDPQQAYNDFNDPTAAVRLHTVESNHLSSDVLHLRKGQTATVAKDLAFALRQFPNHPQALNAMAEWQLKNRIPDDPSENVWTADCYFQRAIAFRPADWVVHFIYGVYLHKAHRLEEAERAYESAEDHGANGPDFFYNRGLLEVDRGDLDRAQACADKATELGHPLRGLREKLAKARAKQSSQGSATRPSPPQADTG